MAGAKGLEFGINLVERTSGAVRRRPQTMRILVLGDYSGRGAGEAPVGDPDIAQRPIVRVDEDNFDDVLWRLAPRIRIPLEEGPETEEVECRRLEDFHPDSLYERLSVFKGMRALGERLQDPATLPDAASELQALLGGTPVAAEQQASVQEQQQAPEESDSEAIERLLGRPVSARADRPVVPPEAVSAASDLVRRIVAPHVVREPPPHQEVYLQALEAAMGDCMRAVLHVPAFQALEARWRSLQGLITGLETDEGLQVYLLDLSRAELVADMAAAGRDLTASGLYRLLVEETGAGMPGGEPWSLVVGDFRFAETEADLSLLAALGAVAAHAGGPFLAEAGPGLLGCRSLAVTSDPSDWRELPAEEEAAWSALRRGPVAPWLGLALPRVLLRLPYGNNSEPVDSFEFEELGLGRRHEDLLWGNPAFACALLIGQAYTERGWSMTPGDVLDLGDLPAYVYEHEGEKHLQACAETYLTERAASAILDRGIMPLLSFKGRNLVRLARCQSIAEPGAALAGPWGGG